MRERNPLHIALGILGLLGALLYVLACRPAWSPDGSKVLFPYTNPETKEEGIALYDRNTGTVRPIFSCMPGKDKCADVVSSAAWSGDGSRAIVLWQEIRENPGTGKKETAETTFEHVDVLPVEGVGKELHVKLRDFEFRNNVSMLPLAESEGELYLSGKGKLVQIDLRSGKQTFRDLEEDPVLFLYSHNGHISYARERAENSDDTELGELDTKDLSLHSWFVLKKKSLEAHGVSDFEGFIAFEPHGNRLAVPAVGTDKKARILMCDARGLERVIKPKFADPASELGNLVWSRDGKTLYAAVVTPTNEDGVVQYSLGEIPFAGGPLLLSPIVRASGSLDDDPTLEQFQISISPDGSTIAASTAHFEKRDTDPANRGLFLVDLRDPARRVTRIQYPPVTGKKRTAGE